MENIRCKQCGAPLDIRKAVGSVLECENCGTTHTLSRSTDASAVAYLQIGEHELDVCRFDDARDAYAKAASIDKNESEAYFGMALSEFKVQYLKDTVENRLQPICHEVKDNKFVDNRNYQKALELATPAQREVYRTTA